MPCRQAKTWLGLAGTVTSLAARDAGLSLTIPASPMATCSGASACSRCTRSCARYRQAQRAPRLLEPQRRVILGGSIVLVEVFEFFDCR